MRFSINLYFTCIAAGIFSFPLIKAQPLAEVIGKRFYEHHSPAVRQPNGAPGGLQSGYDFVNHTYISSFDPVSFGKYANGEEENIDMVEFNGPSAVSGKIFGITTGVSNIWSGDIRGNGTTMWTASSSGFDYSGITEVAEVIAEYQIGIPDTIINNIKEGEVYIARIRNSDMYVAMKCYNVTYTGPGQDIYFDFDYKYGTLSTVGIDELNKNIDLTVYPNPSTDLLSVSNNGSATVNISITSIHGQGVYQADIKAYSKIDIDVNSWMSGLYLIQYFNKESGYKTIKFIRD